MHYRCQYCHWCGDDTGLLTEQDAVACPQCGSAVLERVNHLPV